METLTIRDEGELLHIAKRVLESLEETPGEHVITLQGDLGAGKTAFTKVLAQVLGIEESVTSPTFVIMKSYPIPTKSRFQKLVHIDAYRIEDESELKILHLSEILEDETALVVIEWPERIPTLIHTHTFPIRISITAHQDRLITYGN